MHVLVMGLAAPYGKRCGQYKARLAFFNQLAPFRYDLLSIDISRQE